MKKLIMCTMVYCGIIVAAQQTLHGIVKDVATRQPLAGITVSLSKTKTIVLTDSKGQFSIGLTDEKPTLIFTGEEYRTRAFTVNLPPDDAATFYLVAKMKDIEEVTLSTGYQKIPKERSTGSFSMVDDKLLQQQVTTHLMDRLPAIANGMTVAQGLKEGGQLMIRGLSTLRGPKNPLIIVDHFPYEGDLERINPNIIESVTMLKDAAASSIWGARAANGVIVITTKEGKFNQRFSLELTANTSMSSRPDLYYAKQISSSDFIDVEMQLFRNGFYNSTINSPAHPVITPVVQILDNEKRGTISYDDAMREIDHLRKVDVRDQYLKYMYIPMINRQYALTMSAGNSAMSWSAFAGYDDNTGVLDDKYERLNTRIQNTWKINPNLTVDASVYFTNSNKKSGRSPYNSISMNANWKIPYIEFADKDGVPLVMNSLYNQEYKNTVQGIGLLDWNYYPLTDWKHTTSKSTSNELMMDAGIKYKVLKGLDAEFKYQYQRLTGQSWALNDEESYTTRMYINHFAQKNTDGSLKFNVPVGGILNIGNTQSFIHNIRGQLNYSRNLGEGHELVGMLGGEIRKSKTEYESNRFYGYNVNTQTSGLVDYANQYPNFVTGANAFIENGTSLRKTAINFVSLYANAAYTYKKRYTISGSARQDASNLFGLNTNDQWNPFWSAGLAWNISNESFYNISWLPYIKFRGSYGFNGNIDPAMVAVTTIVYDPGLLVYTGGQTARIDNYFNPNLKWEMMRMINVAVDFSTINDRIAGSIEFFQKRGSNLFGQAPLDYTTGITTMLWNVAGMKGYGLDVELKTKNLDQKLKWNSTLNISTFHDEVTDYYLPTTFASNFVTTSGSNPPISGISGLPLYSMFAYKWAGLDPQTGEARGYLKGEISKDYTKIMASDSGIEDLEYFGSAVPTTYGSFINSFRWKQLTLDIGITYQLGYWFRRSSINYSDLIASRNGHSDFAQRWQKPGDEAWTNVPVVQYTANAARDAFYNGSSALVEKGDHVRMQYLQLGYHFDGKILGQTSLKNLNIYCSVNNLGILWQASKSGTDPDYNWSNYSLKPVTTYSFGLKAQF